MKPDTPLERPIESAYDSVDWQSFAEFAASQAPKEIAEKLLKTAALIGYYHPVSQADLKNMIGPKVYDHIKELKDLGLIKTRKDGPTKIVYITPRFAEYFGLPSSDPEDVKEYLAAQFGLKIHKKGKGKKKR